MGARGPKSGASLSVVQPQPTPDVPVNVMAPEPPTHISDEAAAWWREVCRDFDLESHHIRLLQSACESWDRAQLAREAVARDGITFRDSSGNLKANPATSIERDARTLFARLVRELDLDAEGPNDRTRPPALSSNRGRA